MMNDTTLRPDRRLDDLPELERLWWAEFGDPVEIIARVIIIPAAGFGVLAYQGHFYGLVWAAAYLMMMGMSYLGMRPGRPDTPAARALGFSLYYITASVFLTLPLYFVVLDDFTLKLAGALGLAAYMAFNLFRDEPPQTVEKYDIAMGVVVIFTVWVSHVPLIPSFVAQVVLTLLCGVVGFYYTLAIRKTRASLRDLRLAAARGVEAQKMEALGRLSGGVAHDFNNILTVIRGNLDLYRELDSGPERDAVVGEAQQAVTRAAGLVSQLLTFARRAPLEEQELELGAVVSEITVMAKRLLPESVQLHDKLPGGLIYARLDPAQLNSALLNLILNARDAMEGRGQIELSVTLRPGAAVEGDAPAKDGTLRHVCVAVADTGPGMAPETLEKAFEPFFTTKPVGKGSGLGLPMVKGFAELSGGRISVQTGPVGTVIALHLPILQHG